MNLEACRHAVWLLWGRNLANFGVGTDFGLSAVKSDKKIPKRTGPCSIAIDLIFGEDKCCLGLLP